MKFTTASGVEGVEIRVPQGRIFPIISFGTCRGAIKTIGHYYIEFDMSSAYLINENGIKYEGNCKLSECEGDLQLAGHKLKQGHKSKSHHSSKSLSKISCSVGRIKSQKRAKLKGRSWPWEFLYSETARNTDYNSHRNVLLTMLWFSRKAPSPPMTHNQLHGRSKTSKSVTFSSLNAWHALCYESRRVKAGQIVDADSNPLE